MMSSLMHLLICSHSLPVIANLVTASAPQPTPTPVAPPTDQTGVNGAMIGLARIGAGFLGGVLTLFLVVQGYEYMATDEATRGTHLKRAISALLGGAILVLLAATLAPQFVSAILTGK